MEEGQIQESKYQFENQEREKKNKSLGFLSLPVGNLYEIVGVFLIIFAFFIPLFFIPSPFFPFSTGKMLFVIVSVSIASLLGIMFFLKAGKIEVPRHPLFLALLSVPAVYLLSAAVSKSGFSLSVAGYGSETYAFAAILFFVMVFFLTFFFFRKNVQVFYFYLAIVISALILALFFITRFIMGADFMSLDFFNVLGSSPLESWNGVGVLFGAVFLLSLFTLEMFKVRPILRWVFGLMLAVSLFFMVLTSITWLWVTISVVLLLFVFYQMIDEKKDEESVPFFSVISLFVIIAFVFFGSPFHTVLSGAIGVSPDDLRPNFVTTTQVAKSTLSENPLRLALGAGPMDFSYQWMTYKPDRILESRFWNVEFGQGFSFLTSTLTTVGLLGLLSWLTFFVLYLFVVGRGLFYSFNDVLTRYIYISSVGISIMFMVSLTMTLLPLALLVLFFMFSAIPIGLLVREKKIAMIPLEIGRKTQQGSVYMIVAIIIAGAILLFSSFLVQRSLSAFFFEKSAYAYFVKGDIDTAESNFNWAVTLSPQDRYYRIAAEFPIVRIREALNLFSSGQMSQEEVATVISRNFQLAINRAQMAINSRDVGYRNWLILGNLYQEMIPFGFSDNVLNPYDEARKAYDVALKHNSKNPAIVLQIARLELLVGNVDEADKYVKMSLGLKPNYANAIFIKSQIEVVKGDLEKARDSVRQALRLEPRDAGLYFRLGILHYEDEQFEEAEVAFAQAVRWSPRFDNARYFLSLTLYQNRKNDVAIQLMEDLRSRYNDLPQLVDILTNMNRGVSNPLVGVGDFREPTPQLPVAEEAFEAEEEPREDIDLDPLIEEDIIFETEAVEGEPEEE